MSTRIGQNGGDWSETRTPHRSGLITRLKVNDDDDE